ncbi:MAG: hypothetical protein IPL27_28805, partial [Lewinellaceae bacterium]|nr:hypothetical protein [Lewinellaceae bacterium]
MIKTYAHKTQPLINLITDNCSSPSTTFSTTLADSKLNAITTISNADVETIYNDNNMDVAIAISEVVEGIDNFLTLITGGLNVVIPSGVFT